MDTKVKYFDEDNRDTRVVFFNMDRKTVYVKGMSEEQRKLILSENQHNDICFGFGDTDSENQQSGLWEFYQNTDTGIVLVGEENFKSGQLNGSRKEYDRETGKIINEENYIAGQRHGTWKLYNAETGNIFLERNFKSDKLDGYQKEYNPETGQITRLYYYEKGFNKIDATSELRNMQFFDNLWGLVGINKRDTATLNKDQTNKISQRYNLSL